MPFVLADALDVVLGHAARLPVEQRPALEAMGAVIAEDILAPRPHPPFAAAIKDGYAVRSADGPGEYVVVGASRAGDQVPEALGERQATYITTGAPMPPGTDAVVPVESVTVTPTGDGTEGASQTKRMTVAKEYTPGSEVRAIGSDAAAGQLLLAAGERIGAAEIGLLGSAGLCSVKVVSSPTIAVLSTGNELIDPLDGSAPPPPELLAHRIHDSNRPALLALAAAEGARALDLGVAADSAEKLEAALDAALRSDASILVCSGGVSRGDHDLVKPLLVRRGTVHFGQVVLKPGKPLTFATVERPSRPDLLVFGLPGNPVSAFVCFHLVVAPAARQMMGDPHPLPRRVAATLATPVKPDAERPEFHRALLSSTPAGWAAHSTGGQISSRLLSCRGAEALIEVPASSTRLPVGTAVSALLIGGMRAGRGSGMKLDLMPSPIPPAPPMAPAAAPPDAASHAAPPAPSAPLPAAIATRFASLTGARGCRIGLLCQLTAAELSPGGEGESSRRACVALADALGASLLPGSWLLDTRELAASSTPLERWLALGSMCGAGGGGLSGGARCSVLISVSGPEGAAEAVQRQAAAQLEPGLPRGAREFKPMPSSLGSVVRSASLPFSPGLALLGEWGALACNGTMVLSLPAHAASAVACLEAVLPLLPHAVAQVGSLPPPALRARDRAA